MPLDLVPLDLVPLDLATRVGRMPEKIMVCFVSTAGGIEDTFKSSMPDTFHFLQ